MRRSGHQRACVGTALEDAADIDPDVLLLDYRLPGMNGIELARRLRRIPSLAAAPLLYMTAEPEAADRKDLREVGAEGIIPKPVSLLALAAAVRMVADRAKARQAGRAAASSGA